MARAREATATKAFGTGRRESHDASDFYARLEAPVISPDDDVARSPVVDRVFCGDARDMHQLPDNCVALVVTSPPYYSGKEYERELGVGGVPASYFEFL